MIRSSTARPTSAGVGVESSVPCVDAMNRPRALTVIRREGGVALIPPPGEGATLTPAAMRALIEALQDALPHTCDGASQLARAGA